MVLKQCNHQSGKCERDEISCLLLLRKKISMVTVSDLKDKKVMKTIKILYFEATLKILLNGLRMNEIIIMNESHPINMAL